MVEEVSSSGRNGKAFDGVIRKSDHGYEHSGCASTWS